MCGLDAPVRSCSLSSFGHSQRVPLACAPNNLHPPSRAASRSVLCISHASADQAQAVGVRKTAQFSRKLALPHCFLLTTLDGTFTGFNMGKEIHGTWRLDGSKFCWTQHKSVPPEE